MAGCEFKIDAVELEEGDVSEPVSSLADGPGSQSSQTSQDGDYCSAVDLTYPSPKQDLKHGCARESKPNCFEVIKQGSALSNSFSTQSYTPSLEAFMGSPHLMQALAAFALIGGAEPRGGAGMTDFRPSFKGSSECKQKAVTSPVARSSQERECAGGVKDSAKPSARNKKLDPDANVEMLYCTFCDYSCSLRCTLNVHMMKHDSSKQFTCSECSYTTSRSSDLKKHFRIHTGEKPFKCELCDYKSTEQGALRKHMFTHNCDKPHCCPLCDYVSPRIGDLKRHMYIHSDKKPHACQHCDYKAAQLQHLRKHMLTHTGLKPYQCTYCDYRCREPRNLKTHIQTHTGEKPYSCPHCEYRAGRLGTLRRHVASIHPSDDSIAHALPRHFLEGCDQDDQSV